VHSPTTYNSRKNFIDTLAYTVYFLEIEPSLILQLTPEEVNRFYTKIQELESEYGIIAKKVLVTDKKSKSVTLTANDTDKLQSYMEKVKQVFGRDTNE